MSSKPRPRRGGSRRSRRTDPAAAAQRARQREMDRQLRTWTPRRIVGWLVAVIAVLVAAVHWIAHLGYPVLPAPMGWQDLLVGYPTAALLGVVAAIILGQRPSHRSGTTRPRSRH